MKKVVILLSFYCLYLSPLQAWNAEGHRVVAHIALDNMTATAKARFQVAHPILDKNKSPATFIEAAVWFDTLRSLQLKNIGSMHDVEVPIAIAIDMDMDSMPVNNVPYVPHGLMAYTAARDMLLNGEQGALEQAVALRILLHVTADLHQPLHAATRITRKYPKGDAGGNKTRLPKNKISRNLHTYWDRAGGFLSNAMPSGVRAHVLQKVWPCDLEVVDTNPVHWLAESHIIAEQKAYVFNQSKKLSPNYQSTVYQMSQKRLAEAGCRLAAVLNEIDAFGVPLVA